MQFQLVPSHLRSWPTAHAAVRPTTLFVRSMPEPAVYVAPLSAAHAHWPPVFLRIWPFAHDDRRPTVWVVASMLMPEPDW